MVELVDPRERVRRDGPLLGDLSGRLDRAALAFGMSRGSRIMIECLTIGIVMPVMSASWNPSVPSRSVRTWPVMKTVGTESMFASAIGVTRLVAPGPEVAMQTPTRPVAYA